MRCTEHRRADDSHSPLRARFAGMGLGLVLLAASLSAAALARAHSFTPALLDLRERPDGTVLVTWKTSPVQPAGANVEPVLPAACRPISEPRTAELGDGVARSWTVACARGESGSGLVGGTIAVRDLDAGQIDALVRIALADGRGFQTVLRAGAAEFTIPERPERFAVFRSYLRLGFEHILAGPDHLLFVLGLLLLVRGRRALVETITAFTVGHSLTLTLAVLGIADLSSAVTELAIAASVLALAVEVARGPVEPPSLIRARPWMVALAFGLLHGLGFAGALREVGLPDGEIPLALFSFNVGIELGQLAFVLVAELAWLALRAALARASGRLDRFAWAPSYVMGSLAAYWCFERAAALFR